MTDEDVNWTVNDWLKGFGFEKYLNRFIDNGYETKKLCSNLKKEDLDAMEIHDLPHRSILFNQAEMLRTGSSRPQPVHLNGSSNNNSGYERVLTSPISTASSAGSSDHVSETYSTVFDDITEANKSRTAPPILKPPSKQKSSTIDRPPPTGAQLNTVKNKRTLSTGAFRLHSISTGGPRTKTELKLVLKELVLRDGLQLTEMPYCDENGSPNVLALAEIAEKFSDELNVESLTVMDALEDVWRHKMNEGSDMVIPKSAKIGNSSSLTPGSASSNGSFVFADQGNYSEPFDSKQIRPLHLSKTTNHSAPHISTTSTSSSRQPQPMLNGTNGSSYMDPFDAIDGSTPVIIKTSPTIEKKPKIPPKPSALKGSSKDLSKKSRSPSGPDSPSLSIHSSSSDDIEKSPKVKKTWFRRSGKTPEIQRRQVKKRLSGSLEQLDEKLDSYDKNRSARQSLPISETGLKGLPRSVSSNPAFLYQQSTLIEDLKNSKKKFGGSQGALHQYSPKITSPIANEFHKAAGIAPPPSPTTKSRVKALTLAGEKSSDFELSTVLEVYVKDSKEPVYFYKSQTLTHDSPEQKKNKKNIISRLFKKKHDKRKSKEDKTRTDELDESDDEERGGLTLSSSLPNIAATAAEAKVHSEYTELYDVLQPLQATQHITPTQTTPPKLPARGRLHSHEVCTQSATSPHSSPPAHHKLMIKSESSSSNEIIHSTPSSGDDVIELRVPTSAEATYNEPWTHIPIHKSPGSIQRSPNMKQSNSRTSSGSNSSSSSPRKSSLQFNLSSSPVKRRLFEESVSSSQTLPRYYSIDNVSPSMKRSYRHSTRSLTPEDTLNDDTTSTHAHTLKDHTHTYTTPIRSKTKSSENVSILRDIIPGMHSSSKSTSPKKAVKNNRPKLQHTQSSPGFTRKSEKVIEQLKRTGVSFEGQEIGYTPPTTPDDEEKAVLQTKSSPTDASRSDDIIEVQLKKSRGLKRKTSRARSRSGLEDKIENLLDEEGIDLTRLPYSTLKGEYGIPSALVSRYAKETHCSEEESVKAMDGVRRSQLIRLRRGHIPFKKDWRKFNDINTSTLEDFLVTIGLPQYFEPLAEVGIVCASDLKSSTNERLNTLPLKENHKKHLCAFMKRL